MGKFDKKVAIVTGASSGIGAATAVALAAEGANVVITGRNKERLAGTAKLCKQAGAEVLEVVSDLAKFENLELLVKTTVEKFSKIDILVNNAGYGLLGTVENLELKDYEANFQTNVRAPVFLCKYALPYLKKTKGCIVNVSSVAGLRASPNFVIYAMTKSALDHFTKGFAAETVGSGVRVNSINPAAVDTRFTEVLGFDAESAKKMLAQFVKEKQPLGVITSNTIADAILFLCSSGQITGITLQIDAGSMLQKQDS